MALLPPQHQAQFGLNPALQEQECNKAPYKLLLLRDNVAKDKSIVGCLIYNRYRHLVNF